MKRLNKIARRITAFDEEIENTPSLEERVDKFVEDLKKQPIVMKHLCDYTWTSGSSTQVYPITIWQDEVVLQWDCDKNIFDSFINRMVQKYSDLIEWGSFWKSDGSCPSTITFKLKERLY